MLAVDCKKSLDLHVSFSSAMDTLDENSLKVEESNMELFEAAYKSIFDELVEDAIWELCFEVHKSAKADYFFLEDPEKKYQVVEDAEKDIFGQSLQSKVQTFPVSCPICNKRSCATKFALHLAKCIGISGRSSSRDAKKKIQKESKKNQPKKNFCRKPKIQGNSFTKSSSEINANYEGMMMKRCKVLVVPLRPGDFNYK